MYAMRAEPQTLSSQLSLREEWIENENFYDVVIQSQQFTKKSMGAAM